MAQPGRCSTLKTVAGVGLAIGVAGCLATNRAAPESASLHQLACQTPTTNPSPWHIANLYDCATQALYIPYQLWTGATWDGAKEGDCMHRATSRFDVNASSPTTINGPKPWTNPETGRDELMWVREKANGSKVQYFTCHEKGIGRVYDSRGPRSYPTGRCKFPAGFGWKLLERRHCEATSIEITKVDLDHNRNLEAIEFKWWFDATLDHVYRYVPNYGMTNAWKR